MGSPAENIQALRTYWLAAAKHKEPAPGAFVAPTVFGARYNLAGQLAYAIKAMRELVLLCTWDGNARRNIFAAESVFESCLIGEPASITRSLLEDETDNGRVARSYGAVAPREIMLDGIGKAGSGGFFTSKDQTGVTSWLKSASVAGAAIVGVIKTDPVADVVAAAAKIFRDLAVPVAWLQLAASERVFETLDARASSTIWSSSTTADFVIRQSLKGLALTAQGRVQTDLAKLAVAELPTVPVPTADGQAAATTPPPPKPWWKQGATISAMVLGTLAGGAYANQAPRP